MAGQYASIRDYAMANFMTEHDELVCRRAGLRDWTRAKIVKRYVGAADLRYQNGKSVVYVVGNPTIGVVKFGFSTRLRSRIASLRASSPVLLLPYLFFPETVNYEQMTHQWLAPERSHSEWYPDTGVRVRKLLRFMAEFPDTTIFPALSLVLDREAQNAA
jgi:hypothetical protein